MPSNAGRSGPTSCAARAIRQPLGGSRFQRSGWRGGHPAAAGSAGSADSHSVRERPDGRGRILDRAPARSAYSGRSVRRRASTTVNCPNICRRHWPPCARTPTAGAGPPRRPSRPASMAKPCRTYTCPPPNSSSASPPDPLPSTTTNGQQSTAEPTRPHRTASDPAAPTRSAQTAGCPPPTAPLPASAAPNRPDHHRKTPAPQVFPSSPEGSADDADPSNTTIQDRLRGRHDRRRPRADRLRLQRRRRLRRGHRKGTDQDLVLQQRHEIAWGKQVVEAWNAANPDREGDRRGDPGRQVLRGGHRRGDHRRHRAVPDLQHLPGRRSRLPEAGRPGRSQLLRRRHVLHRSPHRSRREAVRVARRPLLPAAVEVEPGDDLLQQGRADRGRPRPREPAARNLRRVPGDRQEDRRRQGAPSTRSTRRRAASSSSPGSTSTRCTRPRARASNWSRTARRSSTVRRGWRSPTSGRRSTPTSWPATRPTTATPSPTARPRWPSSGRGRSPSTTARSTGASSRCRPRRACPPIRSTPSPTPRTSRCTPPAPTRAPRGTS